jgi:hypothetical protein
MSQEGNFMKFRITQTAILALACLFGGVSEVAASRHTSVAPPDYAEISKGGAQAILEATDEIHFGYRTMWVDSTIDVYPPGETTPRRLRTVMQQDGERRLIQVLEPSDVKGMGILIQDARTMYVYMPEFDDVRRVASHARKQTFLGSDFAFDDMVMSKLSPLYIARIARENDDEVVLELAAREGVDVTFPKLNLYISKRTLQMAKQEYFDERGRHARTQLRANMRTFESEDYGVQATITMIDHLNNDHRSVLSMSGFRANHDIPARVFTRRTLIRGE